MGRVVQDADCGGPVCLGGFGTDESSSIGVASVLGEAAAGDLKPDAMFRQEAVCCRPQVELELVVLAGFHQLRCLERVTVSDAPDAVSEEDRSSVRVDIDKFARDVGVRTVDGDMHQ